VPRFVPNILPINSYLCWPAVLFCVSATRDSSRPLTTIHLWCCASLWYSICQCNVSMGLSYASFVGLSVDRAGGIA
jgi:hypothetical protein